MSRRKFKRPIATNGPSLFRMEAWQLLCPSECLGQWFHHSIRGDSVRWHHNNVVFRNSSELLNVVSPPNHLGLIVVVIRYKYNHFNMP
jgi:hypothetical protein